ncbi:hypothetical protein [Litorihabitans aurantiacus]|uniref:Lipoprotein n=1 Tax=Litorihabitans aurantiacus TaxID=1930061 RepID=A0AA37UR13_9MICO|nr:hypothetical protein [Litorihabitans aurantiacus]GMA30998.1 hypothetical protein GCM10025875_09900 [Litorihabitans aurantiacus]
MTVTGRRTTAALLLAGTLAACSPDPPVDLDAAERWFQDVTRTAPVFGGGGRTSVMPEDDTALRGNQVMQENLPDIALTEVRAACYGGGVVTLVVEVRTSDTAQTRGDELPCDEELHDLGITADGVTTVGFSAYAPEDAQTSYLVVLEQSS